jgi:hypothetical protein
MTSGGSRQRLRFLRAIVLPEQRNLCSVSPLRWHTVLPQR